MPSLIQSSSSTLSKCRTLAAACVAAGAFAFTAPASAATYPTSNLLTNAGFENSALTPIGNVISSPYSTNVWGYEASTITTAVGAVSPNGPTHMLSMTNAGGVATQTVQSVDVSPYATDIATGFITANFNAQFDVDSTVPAAGAGVILQFYDSSHTFVGSTYSAALTLDANPATWQQISLTNIPVPTTTNYVLGQVLYNNASLAVNGATNPGYVDDAVLTLDRTTVPEPGSLMALIPAGALMLIRRRRHIV